MLLCIKVGSVLLVDVFVSDRFDFIYQKQCKTADLEVFSAQLQPKNSLKIQLLPCPALKAPVSSTVIKKMRLGSFGGLASWHSIGAYQNQQCINSP